MTAINGGPPEGRDADTGRNRDELGELRDFIAYGRDRHAAALDREEREGDLACQSLPELRARAQATRERASLDRAHAAFDREAAARDRRVAAHDRERTAAARPTGANELTDLHDSHRPSGHR